jgi:hypothetical protein
MPMLLLMLMLMPMPMLMLDFYPLLPNEVPDPSVEAGCQSLPTLEFCLHSVLSETPCLRRPKQFVKRPSWPFEAIASLSIPVGDFEIRGSSLNKMRCAHGILECVMSFTEKQSKDPSC